MVRRAAGWFGTAQAACDGTLSTAAAGAPAPWRQQLVPNQRRCGGWTSTTHTAQRSAPLAAAAEKQLVWWGALRQLEQVAGQRGPGTAGKVPARARLVRRRGLTVRKSCRLGAARQQ